MNRFLLGIAVLIAVVSSAGAKEDAYDILARELSEINISSTTPKIAIIPFSYVDKRKSEAGVVISERLTTRMVKLKKCKVIERQLLEGVMQELHLEATGVVDAETTKKLGKVLGVEAIITGTLMDTGENKVEVNARTINTETAELLNTCSVELKKTWSDSPAPMPAAVAAQSQDAAPQQSEQQPASVQKQSSARAFKPHGYIDVFLGGGSGTMDVTFNNPGKITGPALGLNLNGNTYNKLEFKDAKTAQSVMPIGVRFVGFGKYWGGAMEMSFFSQHLIQQRTKAYYNGSTVGHDFDFYVDDYLRVDVFTLLSGDVMLRFSQKMIQPYIGLGLGMTLNNVSSPYIYGFSDGSYAQGFNEMAVGVLFRVPIGVRVVVSPTASLFMEMRPTGNTFAFTRGGVSGERDTITMSMSMLLFGAGFRF